ncbi:hypothetical protein PR048_013788 [Dryococelus australis]|uniref:Uncharacterized protein n=1 Tax=Dryococelus australis TaxID=614101 RepID=A0ABQ9HTL2_9NEOP|nr:hypothetical protein PR048_013788 [Dryococelus australis]
MSKASNKCTLYTVKVVIMNMKLLQSMRLKDTMCKNKDGRDDFKCVNPRACLAYDFKMFKVYVSVTLVPLKVRGQVKGDANKNTIEEASMTVKLYTGGQVSLLPVCICLNKSIHKLRDSATAGLPGRLAL